MENTQGNNTVFATMHCGTSPGGPCNETSGIGSSTTCQGTTCQAGFHTYRMEWDRSTSVEEVRFYLDGNNFHTVRANQVDATTWTNATNHGYFIILNVAMGGGFPDAFGGGPDSGTQPGHSMLVDYVQVLTSGGGNGGDPGTPGSRDAYGTIQAESYDGQSGAMTESTSDSGGGQNVGALANGDWLQFKGSPSVRTRPGSSPHGWRAARAPVSAVWSRCGWTAGATRPSAASRWATRAAGSPGGRSRRTSAM
ncbi:hypothetical protein SHKM778_36930 [Streptomyces sp. KM77-8]|uniref:CBM6 domain-containing protein n=1 Tax=Streptomyces haneummycinicus TaxID=3074435 RepID=A0AAT9HIK0_9ACTN